jgi:Periplasmic component of the Tol biopolymer transport system
MSRRTSLALAAAVVLVIAAGLFAIKKKSVSASALRDKTQLTFTGSVNTPALSADGKQLAYFTKSCPTEQCSYAIQVQDVGGKETRQILDGAMDPTRLEWSPDRRNLLFFGTYGGRYGSFLVSALGGRARHLGPVTATFYSGGDSLLVPMPQTGTHNDSAFTVQVTGLTGDVGGIVKVPGGGERIVTMNVIPGTTRFVATIDQGSKALLQLMDRKGNVTDHELFVACNCRETTSGEALWVSRAGTSAGQPIVRIPIDTARGRFGAKEDTVYSGLFTNFAVSADGTKLVVDDGSIDSKVQAMPVADMLPDKFAGVPVMSSSSDLTTMMSPDGNRILKRQVIPNGHDSSTIRVTVVPFAGGKETPIQTDGTVIDADWADSVSVAVWTLTDKGTHFSVVDMRNGRRRNEYSTPDSTIHTAAALANGWVWLTPNGDRMVFVQDGKRREVKKPDWFRTLIGMTASPDNKELLFWGWNAGSNDSPATR